MEESKESKALRFDLDRAGIESRERDAVELVEARARIAELEITLQEIKRDADRALGCGERFDCDVYLSGIHFMCRGALREGGSR